MKMDTQTLHLDVESIQKINAELREENKNLRATIQLIREQYESLQRQLIELKRQHFGSKAEKYIPEQALLFDAPTVEPEPEMEHIEFDRKKTNRKHHPHHVIPDALPRVRIEHQLTEAERICPCGCSTVLPKIGEKVTECLEVKRAELYVNQHVRFKYGKCPYENAVLIANMPTLPIPKSIAGPSLIGQIIVDKYEFHQPLHRQQKRLAYLGMKLHENSLYDWMSKSANLLIPLWKALQSDVVKSPIVNTDDTPIKARIKGQSKAKNGYLWIYIGNGDRKIPVAATYIYTQNRSQAGPKEFLGNYQGYVQADAYSGYDCLFDTKKQDHPRTEVGCWMHARRGFFKIVNQSKKVGAAHQALTWIKQLYKIEEEIKDANADERKKARRGKSKPILKKFKAWLDDKINQVLPNSPLFKAVQYCLNHWIALTRYLEDERLNIDNGSAERGMRPIALGRNNWMTLGSHQGGLIAAIFYSLIETCKIHKINTYDYFTDVLTRINNHCVNKTEELLPYHWKRIREEKQKNTE